MWDLVTKLVWFPFEVMQRISQRVLLISRNVYGSMLGTNRAIEPPPPQKRCTSPITPTTTTSSDMTSVNIISLPIASFSSALETDGTTCSVGEMSSAKTNLSSLLSTTAGILTGGYSSDVEQGNIGEQNNSSAANDCDMQTTFSSIIDGLETECISETVVQNNTHAHAMECGVTAAVVEVTNEVDDSKSKRLREKDKRKSRRQAKTSGSNDNSDTSAVAGDGTGNGPPPSKKEKISEEDSQGNAKVVTGLVTEEDKPKRKNKKRPRRKSNKKEVVDHSSDQRTTEGERMGPPLRPNYFIAIQVSNKSILSKVGQLQQSLTEKTLSTPWHNLTTTEIFKDAMVPVQKLHFTLHVMHLKETDLERAQQVLKDCWSEVCQDYIDDPMDLTIEGHGHFRNNVLFAQIKEEKQIARLEKLSYLFQTKFEELKISGDPRPFKPHMTIAKISRSNKLHKKKIRAFPPEMWSGCEETHFGVQRINSLQLLCMAGEDKLTGYYHCLGQHYFQDPLSKSTSSEKVDNAFNENPVNVFPSGNDDINEHQQRSSSPLQNDNSSSSSSGDSKL